MELNKRVVIVGNGSSSLNAKNGSFIDDSEIVIRIKSFIITGFEEYVGTRTTIWNTKWFSFLDSSYDKQVRLWLPFVDPALPIADNSLKAINDYMLQKNFSDKKIDLELHDKLLEKVGKDYVQFLSLDELQSSFKELNMDTKLVYTKGGISLMHPTTYFYSIFLALRRFKDYKIYVTGFDGFTQGYYWNAGNINKHKKTWPHFYQIENLYIKKLIYSNRITLL
jgi:hypothetical protein